MAGIPSDLKRKAKAFGTLPHELLDTPMIFSSTDTAPMDLTKMRCKHYYKILNESYTTEPTVLKTGNATIRTYLQTGKLNSHLYTNQLGILS